MRKRNCNSSIAGNALFFFLALGLFFAGMAVMMPEAVFKGFYDASATGFFGAVVSFGWYIVEVAVKAYLKRRAPEERLS